MTSPSNGDACSNASEPIESVIEQDPPPFDATELARLAFLKSPAPAAARIRELLVDGYESEDELMSYLELGVAERYLMVGYIEERSGRYESDFWFSSSLAGIKTALEGHFFDNGLNLDQWSIRQQNAFADAIVVDLDTGDLVPFTVSREVSLNER